MLRSNGPLWNFMAVCGVFAIMLGACRQPQAPTLQDLSGREDLSLFKIGSLRGTRDGDRLVTQAMLTDSSSILIMDMRFGIGSPMTLESATWHWARSGNLMSGAIRARSIAFLGGQDGPPSIGGRFDLLGPDGSARYRVSIPTTELKARL
jgi:hypothetical protein